MRSNRQKGFSLIELLIVVAIILIIAAIAIPNLLRSKMAANEASAVASLRTYNTSIVAYETTYTTGPTTNFVQLGPYRGGDVPAPPRPTWWTACWARRPRQERLFVHLHSGCRNAGYAIHDSGRAVVHLDRSAQVLHRPERRDSPDHRRFDADGYQHADWMIGI